MNIHICIDDNFVADSMRRFEQYYPGQNIYVMFNTSTREGSYPDIAPLFRFDAKSRNLIKEINAIIDKYHISNIVLHGMVYWFYPVLSLIKKRVPETTCYWLFWGYELYEALAEQWKYKLVDSYFPLSRHTYLAPSPWSAFYMKIRLQHTRTETLEKILPFVDYFCFWLKSDFELLQKFYPSCIKFKHFQYGASEKNTQEKYKPCLFPKASNKIMVNHQASKNGNHNYVLKKLKEISGIENYQIVTPLSYGKTYIRKMVLRLGKKYFGQQYFPILNLMPLNEYTQFLNTIPVAIFGQRRQEAAGNIMGLIRSGAKVFLRESNPLFHYYKEKGYIIYSFEKDLNTIEDLNPLSESEQMHNVVRANENVVCYDDFMPALLDK